ncbi:hypothetical protein RO3G_10407 [Rhizopus delemar RA 99-880]|uniref:DH domain-containing protein n=1 Tax=Rhizopus delemar (strain RA 99-880 / ATCC MYA-4621 / FGSC 9543 / NRRL 43880) TaxID=246409 RepID=I1CB67_RHIO9|nr:hypothetical protein RO3G_10407 [Rhizopus delemar RA 99-880]|eukprot:EIE85697.1 hypothetical protein RO3G_10407 [Rhizopus delemar RA 99-880]
MSPAEVVRSKYYLAQQHNHPTEDKIQVSQNEKTQTTLYEPQTGQEPKIILDNNNEYRKNTNHIIRRNSSRLLLKLSKSTAPMRAKLSTLSPSKSQLDQLWASSSSTLSRPIRKSAESVHHLSLYRKNRSHPKNERSQSFSFDSHKTLTTTISCTYPALLSKVAESFKDSIVVGNRVKDSIMYHDVFDGKDAVDKLASIIRTVDRDLAILIGRALDHQKYFHDVNYEHRLRDSDKELYQFKDMCNIPTPTKRKLRDGKKELKQDQKITGLPNGHVLPYKFKKEQDFVNDLIYVEEYWISALKDNECIPIERREQFIRDLFWNISEVRETNQLLVQELLQYQSTHALIDQIGKVFLKHVDSFEPFVKYGEHQFIGKHVFETEKSLNPIFAKFVENVERLPESRKLELNGYLTKPTTRLGRYNLLLKEILKNTPKGHPDYETIPKVMEKIKSFLNKVNEKSGRTENRFSLQILHEKLSSATKNYPHKDELDLLADNRIIVLKGSLKKKVLNNVSESSDIQVYVLDHCVLITKSKSFDQVEKYKLYRKASSSNDSILLPPSYSTSSTGSNGHKNRYPLSFTHLGRNGSNPLILYASTSASQKKWLDTIENHKRCFMEQTKAFDIVEVSYQYFNSFFKVNCAAAYKHFLFIGCDHGIYFNRLDNDMEHKENFKRILYLSKVSQIDILEDLEIMLVLADKVLYSCCLDILLNDESSQQVSSLTSTQQESIKQERRLVCYVKYNAMTSTIRVLEPKANTQDAKKKKTNKSTSIFMKADAANTFCLFKDLYIPGEATSIQFFKNVICVGSAKGFQMVDIGSAGVQSVLDPNDENHHFLKQREALRPMSMFKHPNGNILLCYNEIRHVDTVSLKNIKATLCTEQKYNLGKFSTSHTRK